MPLLARTDLPRMTKAEFFDWAERQEIAYELVGGVPVPLHWEIDEAGRPRAMASGSVAHHAIMFLVARAIDRRKPGGCSVLVGGAGAATADDTVREPDVMLACGPLRPVAREAPAPRLVVEILSPSTANIDRGEKLPEYQDLTTVREVWLVDSTRRHVTLHTRGDPETWVSRSVIGRGSFVSPVLGDTIALEELYEGVEV